MFITYLVLKITFQSILNECNRLAAEQESREQIRWLKSRLLKIKLDYEKGIIDEETFSIMQAEILNDLKGASVSP
jgi:hypothetical protein